MEEKKKIENYPYNLLIEASMHRTLELPCHLTRDVQAGIAYALFTLDEKEQYVLDQKFRLGVSLSDDQLQIERKALMKLRHPCRWNYISCGVVGCVKKKMNEAERRGFEQGYHEGYMAGVEVRDIKQDEAKVADIMDFPVKAMPLSSRVCNALHSNGCRCIRDVVMQNIEAIRQMRQIGEKGIKEVVQALHSYGFTHTQWELF